MFSLKAYHLQNKISHPKLTTNPLLTNLYKELIKKRKIDLKVNEYEALPPVIINYLPTNTPEFTQTKEIFKLDLKNTLDDKEYYKFEERFVLIIDFSLFTNLTYSLNNHTSVSNTYIV